MKKRSARAAFRLTNDRDRNESSGEREPSDESQAAVRPAGRAPTQPSCAPAAIAATELFRLKLFELAGDTITAKITFFTWRSMTAGDLGCYQQTSRSRAKSGNNSSQLERRATAVEGHEYAGNIWRNTAMAR